MLDGIKYNALIELIYKYLSVMSTQISQKRIKNLQHEKLKDIMFGWASATERGIRHDYRIPDKAFLIEFDNAQVLFIV